MLDAWGDHPVVAETLREATDALGEDVAKLIHEGPKEALGAYHQHATCDVGGRRGRLPCVDGRDRRGSSGCGWPLTGRVFRAWWRLVR